MTAPAATSTAASTAASTNDTLLGLVSTWQQRTKDALAARKSAEDARDEARRTQVATIRAVREVAARHDGLWDEINAALAAQLGEDVSPGA